MLLRYCGDFRISIDLVPMFLYCSTAGAKRRNTPKLRIAWLPIRTVPHGMGTYQPIGRIGPGRTSFCLPYPNIRNVSCCSTVIGARDNCQGRPVTPKLAAFRPLIAIRGFKFVAKRRSHEPKRFSSIARENAPVTMSANCNPATFAAGAVPIRSISTTGQAKYPGRVPVRLTQLRLSFAR